MTKTMAYYNRHIISEKELEGEFEKEIASSFIRLSVGQLIFSQ
jgi:hypothetical protein